LGAVWRVVGAWVVVVDGWWVVGGGWRCRRGVFHLNPK